MINNILLSTAGAYPEFYFAGRGGGLVKLINVYMAYCGLPYYMNQPNFIIIV